MEIELHQNSWCGNAPVTINLPDDWKVEICGMPADSCQALSREQIKERIDSPYGTRAISELAKGKKEVAIIFDDMSRGTPCEDIAEILLEELHAAGIKKEQIRFICALGSHGTCTRGDFEKKLGSRIIKEYAVFNHSPFQNLTYVGTTSGGVELHINKELMLCDLKIGIGSISPHPINGFGGGGKIAMIGCAGIDTIDQLHNSSLKCCMEKHIGPGDGVGNLEMDGMRKQIEEGVRMIGLDYKVDAILNSACEIVECTAGDPVDEYYAGAAISARLNYCNNKPENMDVVFTNANAKANEAGIALSSGSALLKPDGGSLILIDHTELGQVIHQYGGAFGYHIGGRSYRGIVDRFPNAKQVIFYSPYPDFSSMMTFTDPNKMTMAETWEDVMALLSSYGPGTKAAVIMDGTIVTFRSPQ